MQPIIRTQIKYYVDFDGVEHFTPQIQEIPKYQWDIKWYNWANQVMLWIGFHLDKLLSREPVWYSIYVRTEREMFREGDVIKHHIVLPDAIDEFELCEFEKNYGSEEICKDIIERFLIDLDEKRARDTFKPNIHNIKITNELHSRKTLA